MPSDHHCVCGGTGWDGCEPDAVPSSVPLRETLRVDADRPLGLTGAMRTEQVTTLLHQLTQATETVAQSHPTAWRRLALEPTTPIDQLLEGTDHDRTSA